MVTRPGNRVARISPLVPGVDLVGNGGRPADDPRWPASQVIVHGYDLGVAHHGGFAELARVPAGVGGAAPRRSDGPPGGHHRHGRVHRRPLPPPAGAPRPVPGDGPVLVTGASGGVGSMAVALLAARGYEVVASTGKAAEQRLPDRPGGRRGDRPGRPGRATPERTLGAERWAGAVDCVGGATLAAVLRTLRYGAAVAASGLTGGNTSRPSVYPFIVRDASLLGVDTVQTPIAERRAVWEGLAAAFPARPPRRHGPRRVGLDELGPALEPHPGRGGQGRVLVLVRPGPSGRPTGVSRRAAPWSGGRTGAGNTGETTSVPRRTGPAWPCRTRWSRRWAGSPRARPRWGSDVSLPAGTSE